MAEGSPGILILRYSDRANDSLNQIWWDTAARWSPAQADRYVTFLRDEIEKLKDVPSLGSPVEGADGFRAVSISPRPGRDGHVVVYQVVPAESAIEVLHIFHTKQNWPEQI